MGFIRTVLGDINPESIGRVNYHEHLFQVSPLLPGDELDDEDLSSREATLLAESGFDSFVDATPSGLSRRPAALARISTATGLHIVMTTGVHRSEHYAPHAQQVLARVADLSHRMLADLQQGVPADDAWDSSAPPGKRPDGLPVRAGLVKVGIGYWSIDDFARRAIEAAGFAHSATGAPVMVHLEHGSAAHQVLDLLATCGVSEDRVVLAHIDRNPDPGLHLELAARGAYLGYDGAARHRDYPDSALLECLAAVVTAGGGERVVLGGDVARRSRYIAYGGMPGLAYLGQRFVPRMIDRVGPEVSDAVLRVNPSRLLTWSAQDPQQVKAD